MEITWHIEEELLDWYKLTPLERWQESQKLWEYYLSIGGSLDPEPDSQSPFDFLYAQCPDSAYGRTGVHLVRRC